MCVSFNQVEVALCVFVRACVRACCACVWWVCVGGVCYCGGVVCRPLARDPSARLQDGQMSYDDG